MHRNIVKGGRVMQNLRILHHSQMTPTDTALLRIRVGIIFFSYPSSKLLLGAKKNLGQF